jgi:hypothetical protein
MPLQTPKCRRKHRLVLLENNIQVKDIQQENLLLHNINFLFSSSVQLIQLKLVLHVYRPVWAPFRFFSPRGYRVRYSYMRPTQIASFNSYSSSIT